MDYASLNLIMTLSNLFSRILIYRINGDSSTASFKSKINSDRFKNKYSIFQSKKVPPNLASETSFNLSYS
jgi:hypothetical protein